MLTIKSEVTQGVWVGGGGCVLRSLSTAHLMWIVGHCQANQAGRLGENSRRHLLSLSHFSSYSLLHFIIYSEQHCECI